MSREFEPGDQWSDTDIICPYCGYKLRAEPCDGDASETPKDSECEECGKTYVQCASIRITYTTQRKENT